VANIQARRNAKGETTYRVQVRLKGYPAQSATFDTKTKAKEWAKSTEAAIKEGRHFKTAEAKRHTLADVVDKYLKDVAPRTPASLEKKRQYLAWWKKELGAYSLAELTPGRIGDARDKLLREPRNPERVEKLRKAGRDPGKAALPRDAATTTRYLAALSHALSVAAKEWGWLEDSPMRKVTKPKEPRGRVRFLSDDTVGPNGETVEGERTRLLKACKESSNKYLHPVVVLALATGMRQGEILNLRWADVDVVQGRITLHKTKNDERRVVPLVGHAREVLREFGKVRPLDSDALLFPTKGPRKPKDNGAKPLEQNPQNPQNLWKAPKPMSLRAPWLAALKKAGVADFRFHDLRHSAASYLAMNGASLAEIAEVLGHKTLQMVRRYAHLSEAHTAGVVSRMNAKIFGG